MSIKNKPSAQERIDELYSGYYTALCEIIKTSAPSEKILYIHLEDIDPFFKNSDQVQGSLELAALYKVLHQSDLSSGEHDHWQITPQVFQSGWMVCAIPKKTQKLREKVRKKAREASKGLTQSTQVQK